MDTGDEETIREKKIMTNSKIGESQARFLYIVINRFCCDNDEEDEDEDG